MSICLAVPVGNTLWPKTGKIVIKELKQPSTVSLQPKIPSYVTADFGVDYKTRLADTPVKISAMCYNVAGKDYWMGRGGSTTFGLSMPRTITLTATFDL